jgi:hypothetical protein
MKRVVSAAFAAFFVAAAAHAASAPDLQKADALYQRGEFDQARAIYEAVPRSDKSYETALRQLGAIALYKNHLGEAELMLRDARARNPVDDHCVTLLAETYARQGKFPEMADLLRQLGRPDRAAEFALFGKSQPFRIVGKPSSAPIELLWTNPLPVVRARVGDLDGLFLIDTGAPEVILDPEFALAAHVPMTSPAQSPGRAASGIFGRVPKFVLPGVEMDDIPAMMLSTRGMAPLVRQKRLAGIIGTEFLSHFRFTLDYVHDRLVLEPRDAPPERGHAIAEIPFWFAGDHFLLASGQIDKGPKQLFLIDTGIGSYAFSAPDSTLHDAGIAVPTPKGEQRGGIMPSAPFPIRQLSLGDLAAKNLAGVYGTFPPQLEKALGFHVGGIVAHGFFEPYTVTFDFDRMIITVRK